MELVDLTEQGARFGLKCRIVMTSELANVSGHAAIERLRDALLATADDPATRQFRSVALAGEPLVGPRGSPLEILDEARRFMARARAGIGGVSEGGWLMALHLAGPRGVETVVCMLWFMDGSTSPLLSGAAVRSSFPALFGPGARTGGRDPLVVLTTPGGLLGAAEPDRP